MNFFRHKFCYVTIQETANFSELTFTTNMQSNSLDNVAPHQPNFLPIPQFSETKLTSLILANEKVSDKLFGFGFDVYAIKLLGDPYIIMHNILLLIEFAHPGFEETIWKNDKLEEMLVNVIVNGFFVLLNHTKLETLKSAASLFVSEIYHIVWGWELPKPLLALYLKKLEFDRDSI